MFFKNVYTYFEYLGHFCWCRWKMSKIHAVPLQPIVLLFWQRLRATRWCLILCWVLIFNVFVRFGSSPHNCVNMLINDWSAATASSCFVEFSGPGILANNGVTSIGTIPHFLNPLINLSLLFPSSNALTSWLDNQGKISFGIAYSFWPNFVFRKSLKVLHQEFFNGLCKMCRIWWKAYELNIVPFTHSHKTFTDTRG